jgi:colanic acid biosynthesis glycosyl transferase WcaI
VPQPRRRLRILILTHHYPPEIGAPQTRLSETAVFLQSRGHDVRVLAAFPSYPTGLIPPAYRGRVIGVETIDGIRVYRTWTYARPGVSALGRLLNQLSFTLSAPLALPWVGRRDVILVESPPLFLGATGVLLGRLLGTPAILHVSDLWPAVAIQLGALRRRAVVAAATTFERAVYRLSRGLVVVTEAWVVELVGRGVPAHKIRLVTNGVDTDLLDPRVAAGGRQAVRAELGLGDEIVVVCLGTVSQVYDYAAILHAAHRLRHRSDIRFVIVGDGSGKPALERLVDQFTLPNVLLLPAQPRERVPSLLAAADISAVALRPIPFTRGQLPVRVLEAMAMALPLILAGSGEARRLVEGVGAGTAVESKDVDGLVQAIERLVADPQMRRQMGARGRRAVESRFSRATVASQIERALYAATGPVLGD